MLCKFSTSKVAVRNFVDRAIDNQNVEPIYDSDSDVKDWVLFALYKITNCDYDSILDVEVVQGERILFTITDEPKTVVGLVTFLTNHLFT